MHNSLTRIQTSFGYLTSCAFTLALLISALSLLPVDLPSSSPPPSASLSVRNVQVVRGRPHYYSYKREEYAHIRFDLDADLSGLFNWNTKQVFVYVSAEYPTQERSTTGLGQDAEEGTVPSADGTRPSEMNKAVIWDTIISAPASTWSFANVKERYFPSKKTRKEMDKIKRNAARSGKDNANTKTTDIVKPGLLVLKNQKPKYQITDPSGVIASRPNATLTLSWNVQPWVGPLLWDRGMLEDKRGGPDAAAASWNLPFLKHHWRNGVLPRSGSFNFPPLKGAAQKTSTSESVKDADGPKTPEPAEASGVV
jgi:signal peptidase complex subunit 3